MNNIKPEKTELNRVYHYCELNVPGVCLEYGIFETRQERDAYAQQLIEKWNAVYKKSTHSGNDVESFLGKWRFIRQERSKDNDQEAKTKLLQEVGANTQASKA